MNSLKEVYGNMVQRDHEKVAQARAAHGLPPAMDQYSPELVKQAQAYDQIGRIMAHQAYVDLIKQAMDEAGIPPEMQEEELAKLLAGGEKKEEKKEESKAEEKEKEEGGEAKEAMARKRLAAKKKIMAKMAQDPEYVSRLIAKYAGR